MIRAAILLAAAATILDAAPPVLRELSPRGAQRGKTFTLYLRGEGLMQSAQVTSTLPAAFSRLTPSRDPLAESGSLTTPGSALPFLVSLRADAPTGAYPIRVTTPDGISNVLLFSVGDLPEVAETESKDPKQSNDLPVNAQKLTVPTIVNGTLGADADVDHYAISVRSGEKLVFEVEARRAGSAIDPAIELFDSSGRELAKNDDAPGIGVDARLEFTFPKAGEYIVRVHDSKYSAQSENFYRLKIGRYEYAEALFPLGWKRGEPVDVSLVGGNLAQPVKVKPEVQSKSVLVPVRVPSSGSLPMMFVLSDDPQALEPADGSPMELTAGTVVNGRISKPKEIDRYRLRVTPGEQWVFELTAASLGTSRLDALLTIFDAAGKKLASGDDGDGFDPVMPFTVPAGTSEIALAVEDLLGRGGDAYGYRLVARKQHADFRVDLATPYVNVPAGGTAQVVVVIQRQGYDGEIRLSIPNLPAGFSAAGGHVPSEAAAQLFTNENAGRRIARSVLTLTAAADAKAQPVELEIIAETPDGMVRHARGPGLVVPVRGLRQKPVTAAWLGLGLPMAVTSALPVTLSLPTPVVRIAQGVEYKLDWRLARRAGFKGAARVRELTAGEVGNLRVLKPESKDPDAGTFLLNTNFATPFTTFDMLVQTEIEMDGNKIEITSPVVEIQVVPGYEVQVARDSIEVNPGGRVEVAGKIRREPTFEGGAVKIVIEDLPDNIKCPAVEVPAEKTGFVLACEAAPNAKPGSFPVRIASTAPDTGRTAKQDYKIADVNARLVVAGSSRAAN